LILTHDYILIGPAPALLLRFAASFEGSEASAITTWSPCFALMIWAVTRLFKPPIPLVVLLFHQLEPREP
jgi:hypothetical protein